MSLAAALHLCMCEFLCERVCVLMLAANMENKSVSAPCISSRPQLLLVFKLNAGVCAAVFVERCGRCLYNSSVNKSAFENVMRMFINPYVCKRGTGDNS